MVSDLKNDRQRLFSVSLLILYFLFYLFFAFYDGVVMGADSPGYIEMSFAREPVYPLLLAFFRLFGGNGYLFYVVIFQSCLAACAGWAISDYLTGRFRISLPFAGLVYFCPAATSLLCRFAAGRASMFSNSILSEGITIPLYLLFMRNLLKFLLESSRRDFFAAALLSFLMIGARKQMLITLLLLCLAAVFHHCRSRVTPQSLAKGLGTALLLTVCILGAFRLLDCSYNYVLRGKFQGHSSSNRFVTTMVFYNARRSDADYIADPEIRELFLTIYDICDAKGYLGSHAGPGWSEEVEHFGDHYDHIQIDTMWPAILEHARQTVGGGDTALFDLESDRINNVMIRSVLPHQIPKLMKTLWNNFLSGLVHTVASNRPILIYYSVFIYIAYLLLSVRLLLFVRKTPGSALVPQCRDALLAGCTVLLGIVCNVGLVSSVIFCQNRYTIYNMPLFYMAGVILLYCNWKILYRN